MPSSEELEAFKLTFGLAWATLFVAPALALAVFIIVHKWFDFVWRRLLDGAVLLIVLGAVFVALSFSFVPVNANVIALGVLYFAYGFIAFSVWRMIRIKLVRFVALLIVLFPVFLGSLLGTIGVLGLVFILGDFASSPIKTEVVADGLVCRKSYWGMAATDSGYEIAIYRQFGPFIERKLVSNRVNETNQTETAKGSTCQEALSLVQ